MKKTLFLALSLCMFLPAFSQQIKVLNTEKANVSFRGLSVIDDFVFWVSGDYGTIGMTMNGGKSFQWKSPKGYENRDFRAIHAFNHKMIIAVAVGSPGIIIKSFDSGNTWHEVYKDENAAVFLDAINFNQKNPNQGFAIGDPVDGKPYILKTENAGNTWELMDETDLPKFNSGEAFFAASNSNIFTLKDNLFMAVTGGSASNLLLNTVPTTKVELPKTNSSTAGANGMDYWVKDNFGLIAGGDFSQPESSENNLFIFELDANSKPTIHKPETAPNGYKSSVAIINKNKAIACGLKGIDYSNDGGKNWKLISEGAFHSCKKAIMGTKLYMVGPKGKIGQYLDN